MRAPGSVLIGRLLAHDQCQRLDFFDGAHAVVSIAAKDFRRVVNPRSGEFSRRESPPLYRAKVARLSPLSAAPGLKEERGCLLGISLENEEFERPERLGATLEWIDDNFDECLVVIADSIHRLTLQIRDPGLGEAEALGQAIALGRRFRESNQPLFEAYSRRCRFTIVSMSDPAYRDPQRERIRPLERFQGVSGKYRQVVGTFARDFVHRQPADAVRADRSLMEDDLRRVSRYLIEEAAFCELVEDLWNIRVLVYPGSLGPFREISEGKIPEAPEGLRRLRLVSLDLRRQWLAGERPPRVKGAEPQRVSGCLVAAE
jgi:tRNA-dependent cyclodipeptide synthase